MNRLRIDMLRGTKSIFFIGHKHSKLQKSIETITKAGIDRARPNDLKTRVIDKEVSKIKDKKNENFKTDLNNGRDRLTSE